MAFTYHNDIRILYTAWKSEEDTLFKTTLNNKLKTFVKAQ